MRNLLLTILLLLPIALAAQEKKTLQQLMDGQFRDNAHVTMVKITNQERLIQYRLNYFLSITVTDDEETMNDVAAVFADNLDAAIDKEISTVGNQIYYGFCQIPDMEKNGYHRYIFFKDLRVAPDEKQLKVTYIFMMGQADLPFLKSKFCK